MQNRVSVIWPPHPFHLTPWRRWIPNNIFSSFGVMKLESLRYNLINLAKIQDYVTIPASDRQTDRKPIVLCIALRKKLPTLSFELV